MDAAYNLEHERLLSDLRQTGFALQDIWDWVNGPAPVGSESILLSHLEYATSEKLVEGIARALTQKNFRNAVPALLQRFVRTSCDSARWAIANAIAYQPFPKHLWEDILAVAVDPKFGSGRQNLVWRLHRVKLPGVETTLLELVDDPDVDAFALMALKYCGSFETYETLRRIDPAGKSLLFKRELTKTVKRLEKRLQPPQR